MWFTNAMTLFVLGILLVASSLENEWHEAEISISTTHPHRGYATIGCKTLENLREIIRAADRGGYSLGFERYQSLSKMHTDDGTSECTEVELEGDETFVFIERHFYIETRPNYLAQIAVVKLERPNGAQFYIGIAKIIGPGQAL